MSEAKTELSLFSRNLTLHRYPLRIRETLQAWDAGDEYLITHAESLNLPENSHILILNDSFGALSCWFAAKHKVTMISDSFVSHQAAHLNFEKNGVPETEVKMQTALEPLHCNPDLVLMQLPKNNRLLKWQLFQLRTQLSGNCPVIGVNKVKEIHTSTLNLFERYLGNTTTSLARKKHRLVFCQPDKNISEQVDPVTEWHVDGEDFSLKNLPNTYSGESLDLGARFMLAHIPADLGQKQIIDLGCGNGVLSVKTGQLNPEAQITCVDESYMSVEASRQNLEQTLGKSSRFSFAANNCLDGFDKSSADLVLCNPPFHQNNAITDHIAWQMFCDAKHVLRPRGQLMVIGNRHLGYDVKLSRLFGRSKVRQIAANNKFVILQATR